MEKIIEAITLLLIFIVAYLIVKELPFIKNSENHILRFKNEMLEREIQEMKQKNNYLQDIIQRLEEENYD